MSGNEDEVWIVRSFQLSEVEGAPDQRVLSLAGGPAGTGPVHHFVLDDIRLEQFGRAALDAVAKIRASKN